MDDILTLHVPTYSMDAKGNRVPSTVPRYVMCRKKDVTRAEWYSAGRDGFRPALTVEVFADDYNDEQQVSLGDKPYTVYRTFRPEGSDYMELYLERRVRNG